MEPLISFFAPVFFAGLYLGVAIAFFHASKKRQCLRIQNYLMLGLAGYGVLYTLTWGWLQIFELAMMILCAAGMAVASVVDMVKSYKEQRQMQARSKARRDANQDFIDRWNAAQSQRLSNGASMEELEVFLQDLRKEREQPTPVHLPTPRS